MADNMDRPTKHSLQPPANDGAPHPPNQRRAAKAREVAEDAIADAYNAVGAELQNVQQIQGEIDAATPIIIKALADEHKRGAAESEAEVQRLRKVLEWYADPDNYEDGIVGIVGQTIFDEIDRDNGDRACEALKDTP